MPSVLMAPGSFVVLPLLWLAQHWASRNARLTAVRTGGHTAYQEPRKCDSDFVTKY